LKSFDFLLKNEKNTSPQPGRHPKEWKRHLSIARPPPQGLERISTRCADGSKNCAFNLLSQSAAIWALDKKRWFEEVKEKKTRQRKRKREEEEEERRTKLKTRCEQAEGEEGKEVEFGEGGDWWHLQGDSEVVAAWVAAMKRDPSQSLGCGPSYGKMSFPLLGVGAWLWRGVFLKTF